MFLANLLERLAEFVPKQDYQNRLDQYIAARRPTSNSEVEYWHKQFESQESKGISL